MYRIQYAKRAIKDIEKLKATGLAEKAKAIIAVIKDNPYQNPPGYEKLKGMTSTYSRRINRQHRLVYVVLDKEKIIRILRMWTHYE